MKQFKQFKSEQQVINEIGPFGATMMAAMGIVGGGIAAYKLFKLAKGKVKGYKETKAEKEQNPGGERLFVPEFNPSTGKIEKKEVKSPKGGSTNKDLADFVKKFKDKAEGDKEAWDIKNPDKTDAAIDKQKKDTEDAETKGKEAEKKADEAERDGIEDVKDAEEYFKNNGESPAGWRNAGDKNKPELMTTKDYDKELERRKKVKKHGLTPAEKQKQADTKAKLMKRKDIDIKKRKIEQLLNFGEFISEDVMGDLLKATKSKKDSEITLDDGADIPIDPLTASILVKYIEGLGSAEKTKTINKIQRTERAFMKVLGQAHGE